jgi:rhamnose transport system ATP-binding protein
LSGGNRQKVVLAKWLATAPKLLLLDEPTHGIDVGAKAQLHELIETLRNDGVGILLISSDLPEVLRLGDRILAVAEGRIAAEFDRLTATQENIMMACCSDVRSEPEEVQCRE